MDDLTPDEVKKFKAQLSLTRAFILSKMPFFGYLLLKLIPTPSRQVPVAGVTRSRELHINVDWFMKAEAKYRNMVLIHEVMHPAMLYWERQGHRNAMGMTQDGQLISFWNIAHDYAINLIINEGIKGLPSADFCPIEQCDPPGLVDAKYASMSAEEIYAAILEETVGSNRGGNIPNHLRDTMEGPGDSGSEGAQTSDAEEEQYWKLAVVEAAQVHEEKRKSAPGNIGQLPAAIQKMVKEITEPRVAWQDVLSRWVGENGKKGNYTYRRPSRRSHSIGEIMPSLQKFGCSDVCVLWDTSGSMGGREVEIMTEVIGICTDMSLSLRVICCDAAIQSDQSDVSEPEDVEWRGGGGSSFLPAFDRLDHERYEGVVVVFTDGYIAVPQTKPDTIRDVLWCIWPGEKGDMDPTQGRWGEVIFVDEDGKVKR